MVCVCMRACGRACVRACVREREREKIIHSTFNSCAILDCIKHPFIFNAVIYMLSCLQYLRITRVVINHNIALNSAKREYRCFLPHVIKDAWNTHYRAKWRCTNIQADMWSFHYNCVRVISLVIFPLDIIASHG